MSLSYIFDRLLIRFEKFVRWFKPNDEEIRPGIRKPTTHMLDEYAEGDGIEVAKEFYSARMLIDDLALFDKHVQPCINRLLKELIISCTEETEKMSGYCEFANEFTEWIDSQKEMYVKRLRDDSGNIVTQHSSLTTIDVIVGLDYMINEYAPLFFRNHFPIPKRVANWKPFLSDRVFHLYKQVIRAEAQLVGSELETFVKDSASDLNPDMGGLMDWQQSVDVLTKKQEEVYRVLDSPEEEPLPIHKAWSEYDMPKEEEEKREEDKISEDTVRDVLSKVQSGGALSSTDEQVLMKIEDAKSPSSLATFRSNFIKKTFRPNYEPIISALVDDKNFKKDVPVDWALEQVGCNSWFNEFVIRSILGNCRGKQKYAHRFKPHTVVRKKVSNRTKDEMGNPVDGRLEKDFPPQSAGGKWTPEPSTDNPNYYKVWCFVVVPSD